MTEVGMGMKTVALDRMHAAYLDLGAGPPVILVHCSSASHKEWSSLTRSLSDDFRVLAPDLLGYGTSSPWPETDYPGLDSDLDVLEALIEIAGPAVHLVGHSYGGAVCLEAARRDAESGQDAIGSLCLIEPVSFHLLRTANRDREWKRISAVARAVIAACAAGKPKKAANGYMGFWIGPLKWRLSPSRFRNEVVRTVPKVAHEFTMMFENNGVPDDYSRIGCPVTLIRGGRSPRAAAAVVEILKGTMSQARVLDIPSAGHMSPFTHKQEVGRLICSHLAVT